jgi:hypothetical protein
MLYVYAFDYLSVQKSVGSTQSANINENNMLAHRFCVAPMMDWTGTSQKAKRNQRLSPITKSHAVPILV